jgi:hypothetical protein
LRCRYITQKEDLKQIPDNFSKKALERGDLVCKWDLGMGLGGSLVLIRVNLNNDAASSGLRVRDAKIQRILPKHEI